jgi:hypothetical protein
MSQTLQWVWLGYHTVMIIWGLMIRSFYVNIIKSGWWGLQCPTVTWTADSAVAANLSTTAGTA